MPDTSVHVHSHPDSPGDSPRPAGRSGPGSCQITAFALVPVPVRFCMHYLRVKTISSSLVELPKLSPAGFQSQRLWGLMESTFLSCLFPKLEPRSSGSCSEHFSQLFCKVRVGPGCQFFCRAQHSPGQTEILCWTLSVDQVFDEGLCKDGFSFSFHAPTA